MKNQKIIIAVPRGRITEYCKDLLNRTNFAPDPQLFIDSTRKLTFNSKDKNIDYIKVRSFDVAKLAAKLPKK